MIESRGFDIDNKRLEGEEMILGRPVRIPDPYLRYAGLYPGSADGRSYLIIDRYKTLPLSTRSHGEIFEDQATEWAFQASQNRSNIRRRKGRFESQFVVDYLDALADATDAIGERAVQVFMTYAYTMYPEPLKNSGIPKLDDQTN